MHADRSDLPRTHAASVRPFPEPLSNGQAGPAGSAAVLPGAPRLSASAMLSAFQEPALLLDLRGGLHATNPSADRLLERASVIAERHGRLAAVEAGSDSRMAQALRRLGDDAQRQDPATVPVRATVLLTRAGQESQVVLSLCTLPWSAAGTWWPAFVLARLHDPEQRTEVDRELLGALFELTPAEARVTAMLAEGHAPKDIASLSGVALGTVRTQLKSVFAKTGTCRQADLVRLVAALPRAAQRPERA